MACWELAIQFRGDKSQSVAGWEMNGIELRNDKSLNYFVKKLMGKESGAKKII